jgi:hypothetical protein
MLHACRSAQACWAAATCQVFEGVGDPFLLQRGVPSTGTARRIRIRPIWQVSGPIPGLFWNLGPSLRWYTT